MARFTHPTKGVLPIVPFPAEAPLRETLEFLTDVMTSFNGTEGTRLSLRNKPRQRFDTEIPLSANRARDIYNTVRGNLANQWLVPVWSQQRIAGTLSSGSTTVACDTTSADFRVGSPVLLLATCGTFHIAMVTAMTSASLTLAVGVVDTLRNASAVPVRLGRLVGSVQKNTNGYSTSWKLSYEIDDNLSMVVEPPVDQYLGDDIYYDTLLIDGTLEEKHTIKSETFDGETGAVKTFPDWVYPRSARVQRWVAENASEAWALRQFMYRRAGRYRGFWQPSFEHDVRLAQTGLLGTTVVVNDDTRAPFAIDRTHLAFKMKDGSWLPRKVIADVASGVSNRQFTLDTALGVQATDVVMISYLGYRRLNSDSVDFTWVGNGVCEVSTSTLELNP